MSYLVFARKYRPLTFEDVVGQQHITQTLKKAIEKNRVAHAYIFTGTRGVGKTTTARILARALNCDKGPTPEPCGTCESCKQIIAGASLDVLEVDGASNNSVEDVRELRDSVTYSSMAGKYRIFVIDEVHMLSKSAFNALLKTLEEPPPRVIFIFATTEPQRIPATIQSRCQRYDFRRISTEQIRGQLARICQSEKVTCEEDGLALIARKADGSMRDALSLLDQVYSYCQGNIGAEDVRTVLGLVGSEVYGRIVQAVLERDPQPVLDVVQDVLYRGFDLQEFVVGLEEYLRDLLLAKLPAQGGRSAPEGSPETLDALRSQGAHFSEATLLRMADIVRRAEYELKHSAYPRFLVESMLLKLVHLEDTVSVEQLLGLVVGATPPAPASPAPVSVAAAPPPAEPSKKKALTEPAYGLMPAAASHLPPAPPGVAETPVADGDSDFSAEGTGAPGHDVGREWKQFLESLHAERPTLAAFLTHANVAAFHGSTLDLRFASAFKFQFSEVAKSHNREALLHALAVFAGKPVELHITLEHAPAAQAPAVATTPSRPAALAPPSIEDDIQNEPIIRTVLETFDGEVLD